MSSKGKLAARRPDSGCLMRSDGHPVNPASSRGVQKSHLFWARSQVLASRNHSRIAALGTDYLYRFTIGEAGRVPSTASLATAMVLSSSSHISLSATRTFNDGCVL